MNEENKPAEALLPPGKEEVINGETVYVVDAHDAEALADTVTAGIIDRLKDRIGDIVKDRVKDNVTPSPNALPEWAKQLGGYLIAILLAFLAAKYGIEVPPVTPAQPTVLVIGSSGVAPYATAATAGGK
jgi:hypothetical protein